MMQIGKNPEPRKKLKKNNNIPYQVEEYISLPKANEVPDVSFFDVLKNRKSERSFSPLTIQQISDLLWNAAKVKSVFVSNEGQILSHRTSISAGAIHPIDIFLSPAKSLVERELFYYDPFGHKLGRMMLNKQILFDFFKASHLCLDCTNATIVWFGGSIERTWAKYINPESLVWRDAGALLMTIHLASCALNLKSSAIGTLAEPNFTALLGEQYHLKSVGGILVGN
jgi:SagB-type dehydrogenase family enzyme